MAVSQHSLPLPLALTHTYACLSYIVPYLLMPFSLPGCIPEEVGFFCRRTEWKF